MSDPLTPAQLHSANRVLAEEGSRREHLVIALTGAHAYGFASEDSDVDLKGIHVAPSAGFLGLDAVPVSSSRLEVVDGVEIDYASNEVGQALRGILQGSGNMIERALAATPMVSSPGLEGLREVAARNLSRLAYHHYRGFASSQRREVVAAEAPVAKKVLYVLRTALTGTHLLRTGQVVPDLTALAEEYRFPEARDLVDAKRHHERGVLPPRLAAIVPGLIERVFTLLEDARQHSPLPDEAPCPREAHDWLVGLRRARW